MTRIAVDGIALNVEEVGQGHPLILLHGFTGSTRTWDSFVPAWARDHRVLAVDILGHGDSDSPADPERYTMDRCVEDLVALLDRLGVEDTHLLGYSMGGRVALHLAAAQPQRIAGLVLESASPGLASAAERAERVRSDERLAASIERDGLERFVDDWEAIPLFASQQALPAETRERLRRQRLRNDPAGLAHSLRGLGTGHQAPLWDRLASVAIPTLVVVGELDAKYREIGARMAALMPLARLEVVPAAGHAIHLEQPERFGRAVSEFLAVT